MNRLFEDILNTGADLRIMVTGTSMEPFLQNGDVVYIRKASPYKFKIGDLIFFTTSYNHQILHRIITKKFTTKGLSIATKGDCQGLMDTPISGDAVLGRVWKIEKKEPLWGRHQIVLQKPFWKTVNYLMTLRSLLNRRS